MEEEERPLIVEAPHQIDQYVLVDAIGSGAFATVYRAQHMITMANVAIKVIPKDQLKNKAEFELLQREVNLIKSMDHPFIASFFEVLDDEKNFYLVQELVENGNLLDYVNVNKGLKEQQARRVFCQLIAVLDYLHETRHVVHRDLKAENVLLDRNYNIRLVDFGLSKAFTRDDPFLQTTCGSPAYVAPEIIREKPYTSAADIWSAGVLLYAMVVGTLPFNGDNISFMLQQIITVNPVIPRTLSPELRHLISKLLTKEPSSRITLKEIQTHPWVTAYDDARYLDESVIEQLKTFNVPMLDAGVVSEMRILNYDTNNLLQEVQSNAINRRTAAYKMLRRQRIIEEMSNWQNVRARAQQQQQQNENREDKLPLLDTSLLGAQQKGPSARVAAVANPSRRPEMMHTGMPPRMRKRGVTKDDAAGGPKTPHTLAPLRTVL